MTPKKPTKKDPKRAAMEAHKATRKAKPDLMPVEIVVEKALVEEAAMPEAKTVEVVNLLAPQPEVRWSESSRELALGALLDRCVPHLNELLNSLDSRSFANRGKRTHLMALISEIEKA